MNPYDIIYHFYPQDTPLRRLLILHSEKVRDKAFEILGAARRVNPSAELMAVDEQLVNQGALLHDIGIGRTNAPGILCEGSEPYICHGTIGAQMLRELIAEASGESSLSRSSRLSRDSRSSRGSSLVDDSIRLEQIARICERHTGAGLTKEDIVSQNLPIEPVRDLVPETLEEKLVCLADKFYSKSGDPGKEKSLDRVKRSMMKFGADSMARFDNLCSTFYIK